MQINAPLTMREAAKYWEGSKLAPARDNRNVASSWKKGQTTSKQQGDISQVLQKMSAQMSKMRRKPLGGYVPDTQTFQAICPFGVYNVPQGAQVAINNAGTGYDGQDVMTLSGGTLAPGGSPTQIGAGGNTGTGGELLGGFIIKPGNYTVQPTYPNALVGGSGSGATVTLTTDADGYRTFGIRSGLIGLRSRFFNPLYWQGGDYPHFNNPQDPGEWAGGLSNTELNSIGNYNNILGLWLDGEDSLSQPLLTGGGGLFLSKLNTPTLISGFDDTTGDWVNYAQIILDAPVPPDPSDPNKYTGNLYFCAIWLEVIDDPAKPVASSLPSEFFQYVNVKAQMYDGQGFPYTDGIGKNVNVIPIASIEVDNRSTDTSVSHGTAYYHITQFLSGNLLNLYDSMFCNQATTGGAVAGLAAGAKMIYRGDWDEDNLSGQCFYPGDFVTYGNIDTADPTKNVGGFKMRNMFLCTTFVPMLTTTPPSTGANWIQLNYWS